AIVKAIRQTEHKPNLVIQASAVGYYGTRGDEILYEDSPSGAGFLADVSKQWEQTIQPLANSPTRLAVIRLGPVLGAEGGMMQKLLPAFRLFLGGHPGSGKQWLSWIHIDDVTSAIRFLIENPALRGVFNLTSPHPAPSRDFYRLLGKLMHRPALLPLPVCLLKVLMGQMAEELLLSSLRVLPNKLLQAGYRFKYADPESALKNIVEKTDEQKE
ncbi:MAG: TIGR01777 family oxidoreductase, partial [Planctomycetota bacterium]